MRYVYDDGGRVAAGLSDGYRGDCVTRSIAIATGIPYRKVYDAINEIAKQERPRKRMRSSARNGVQKPTIRKYMDSIGWRWVPTMQIGSGCTMHLNAEELPPGRLVVAVSRHVTAVVDGVCRDIFDPSRDGNRCVYGYWIREENGNG